MKTDTKDQREVKRIFAFFPQKCINCGKTFWFEKGWYRYLGGYFSVNCCNECAKNEEEAKEKCVLTVKRPTFQPVRKQYE